MTTQPLIIDCVLVATGTDAIGVDVTGSATLAHNLIAADTAEVRVRANSQADVIGNEYVTVDVQGNGVLNPIAGDRAVFDALDYQARHTNDIDNATGIHHTRDYLS